MKPIAGAREAMLAVLAALIVYFAAGGVGLGLRELETASLDLRFRLRGERPLGNEVGVILVDDASLAAFGRWPFNRHLIAQAIRKLAQAKAKVIVLDLLLAEPAAPTDSTDPDGDLANAIRESGHVLLPVAFGFTGAPGGASDALAASAYMRFDPSPEPPAFPMRPVSVLAPVPRLASAAQGSGHVNIAYDRDGSPRYDYLALPFGGDFFPSLAVRAAAAYRDVAWPRVGLALGQGVTIGDTSVPTDSGMRMLVNYPGPRGTVPTYSFSDLLRDRVAPAALAGKVIVVGASFLGNSDANAGPFGNTPVSGAERLAGIIDTIAGRRFIRESPSLWPVVVPLLLILFAAGTGVTAARLPISMIPAAGAFLVAWAAGAQLAFVHGLWLPLVNPLLSLAAALAASLLFRYWVSERDARFIRSAFGLYLAPQMVTALAANPERLRLGGETRTMTILFCDIRGFTGISEALKDDPQALTQLINRFLTPMSDIILAHGGTIDKYIGDCIMAFWNAPLDDADHAAHACEAALRMLAALADLNRQFTAGGPPKIHPLRVGIGINSGNCVVGNMGSDRRFGYSVLGDTVNLASRLEGQSKPYGVDIVVGDMTRALAPAFAYLEIDRIKVMGKNEPARIYALLGDAKKASDAAFLELTAAHEEMLAHYRAQNWTMAKTTLAHCRACDGRLAALYDFYDQRIAWYEDHPPGEAWDGVFVATSK